MMWKIVSRSAQFLIFQLHPVGFQSEESLHSKPVYLMYLGHSKTHPIQMQVIPFWKLLAKLIACVI